MIRFLDFARSDKVKSFLIRIIRNQRKYIIFTFLTLILSLSLGSIFLIKVSFKYIKDSNQQEDTKTKVFNFDDKGSYYQIKKCLESNPPSYWLVKFGYSRPETIKADKCNFLGTEAIKISGGSSNDTYLDRTISAIGKYREDLDEYYLKSVYFEPSSYEKIVINKVTPSGEEKILKFDTKYVNDINERKFIKWKDNIFYHAAYDNSKNELDENYENIKLYRYDLNTGEKHVVYTEENTTKELYYISVINDELYFSVLAHMAGSDIFWLSSPDDAPHKLDYESQSGFGAHKIVYEHGRYWLIGGVCTDYGCTTNYYLFNPKDKTTLKMIASEEGYSDGEEYIGVDQEDRMIIAYHENNLNDTLDRNYSGIGDPLYKYIYALPIDNSNNKVNLLTKDKMPSNVHSIKLFPKSNKIILIGEEVNLFDLNSLNITKILSLPEEWILEGYHRTNIYNVVDNIFCISKELSDSQEYDDINFQINVQDGSVERNSQYCQMRLEERPIDKKFNYDRTGMILEKLKSELNLPSNYKVSVEVTP